MILINEVKYSCMECIRGHRSSLCKHHARPLLQVRSKGRPGGYANGNPNHRVAVFAQEIASPEASESDSPSSSLASASSSQFAAATAGECKTQPIVILKASSKKVIDLSNGKIVGPYDETKDRQCVVDRAPRPQPVISDESFIVTTPCHGGKVTKRSSDGCCCNKAKDINKNKIWETYIRNRLDKRQTGVNTATNSTVTAEIQYIKEEPSKAKPVARTRAGAGTVSGVEAEVEVELQAESVFEVVPVASCSIPGTCCCGSDCSCEGCIVHGNAKTNKNIEYQYNPIVVNLPEFQSEEDLIFNSITSYNINGALSHPPPAPAPAQSPVFLPQHRSHSYESSPGTSCACPPNECECSNCETHGIIDGHKLDEFFNDDQKLMNVLTSEINFDELIQASYQSEPVQCQLPNVKREIDFPWSLQQQPPQSQQVLQSQPQQVPYLHPSYPPPPHFPPVEISQVDCQRNEKNSSLR